MSSPQKSTTMKLDVTKISERKGKEKEEEKEDKQIALLLQLPSGKTDLRRYRPDLTVGYVKVELAKLYNLPYDTQEFELNGKVMADPFSLSDYPELRLSRSANPVRIVVKEVKPEGEEGGEDGAEEDGKGEDATSDYDDESFED